MDIARVNIKTGEGFCRIGEIWENECVTRSQVHIPEVSSKKDIQEPAPPLLIVPESLPPELKERLQVIVLSNQGFSNGDIAKMTGKQTKAVGNILHWKEQITLQAKAIEQCLEGKTVFQVSQMLRLAPKWIKNLIKKYNLERMMPDASGL